MRRVQEEGFFFLSFGCSTSDSYRHIHANNTNSPFFNTGTRFLPVDFSHHAAPMLLSFSLFSSSARFVS